MAVTPGYRLGTFSIAGCAPFAGVVVSGDRVVALAALNALPDRPRLTGTASLLDFVQDWPSNSRTLRELMTRLPRIESGLPFVPLTTLRTHAPLIPRNLVCAATNYRKHVLDFFDDEVERASWAVRLDQRANSELAFAFGKPVSAITDPDTEIELPFDAQQLDWEIELAVVMGREARRVPRDGALDYVAGYTLGNDISARDFMKRDDVQPGIYDFFGAKSNPGFNPLGPFLVPAEFVPDPQALWLRLKLNGQVMQDESTADMIDSVAKLIAYLSARMTLQPGDIIMTGTPSGVAACVAGDKLECEVEGLPKLTVTIGQPLK